MTPTPHNAQPPQPTKQQLQEWRDRHGFDGMCMTDLRCAYDDAASEVTLSLRAQLKSMTDQFLAVSGQLGEARKPIMCSVCAGTGKPVSGLPCICGGVGTQDAELQGFREAHYDQGLELDKLRAENKALREAAKPFALLDISSMESLGKHPDHPIFGINKTLFTLGDVQWLRAHLAQSDSPGAGVKGEGL